MKQYNLWQRISNILPSVRCNVDVITVATSLYGMHLCFWGWRHVFTQRDM